MKKIIVICIILVLIIILLKTTVLERFYPKKYCEYVEKYSQEYQVDPLLIYSIMKAESNFNQDAKSSSQAIGLMQIMQKTAEEMANGFFKEEIKEEDLYNPELNIRIGVKYIRVLLNKYNNYKLAIIAYNAGMGNVDKWIEEGIIDNQVENLENIPFKETKDYAKRIIQNYRIYQEIYK